METQKTQPTIVDFTRKGILAKMTHYRDGYFYYHIELENGDIYRLVLDIKEFQGCDLEPVCNASLFRRWIREAWIDNQLNKVN